MTASAGGLLRVLDVGLAHKFLQGRIDVGGALEAKVMAVAESAEILCTHQTGVFNSTPEPKTCIDPRGTNYRPGEANPLLQNNSRFLSVDSHGASFSGGRDPATESRTQLRRLSHEV